MIRALVFLLVVLAISAAVGWFADDPGRVTLAWRDWRVDTSAAVLAGAAVLFAVAVAALYRLWLFFKRAPERIGLAWTSSQRRKGYLALTRGMVAVAAGDAGVAARQAKKASALLHDPPLTLLLEAQSAQLKGDEKAAERFFTAMLDRPEMAFLGLRGLLGQATAAGDRDRALDLAGQAHQLEPKSEWVSDTLFRLQTSAGAWGAAQETLNTTQRRRLIGTDTSRRRRAVLEQMQSKDAFAKGVTGDALAHGKKAFGLDRGFVPAASHYARLLIGAGKQKRARGVIEDVWKVHPHPDLVPLYAEASKATDGLTKLRALERLVRANPNHSESHLTLAEAALEARLWGEARRHLEALGVTGAKQDGDRDIDARACRLMAALLEGDKGDMAGARAWLARAAQAAPDPTWVCDSCGNTLSRWAALCARCGGFDTFCFGARPHVTARPKIL